MKLLLVLMLLTFYLPFEVDTCCKNKEVGQCCVNGLCNVFCCYCDRGCNKLCETDFGIAASIASLRGKMKTEDRSVVAAARCAEADGNVDGHISLAEASDCLGLHVYVKRDVDERFAEMDVNNDKLILPAEFDLSLA